MRELVPFCQENDPRKPNFIEESCKEGLVRVSCIGDDPLPINEEEELKVEAYKNQYYRDNWHKVIMPILRYKQPQIVNADHFSKD